MGRMLDSSVVLLDKEGSGWCSLCLDVPGNDWKSDTDELDSDSFIGTLLEISETRKKKDDFRNYTTNNK